MKSRTEYAKQQLDNAIQMLDREDLVDYIYSLQQNQKQKSDFIYDPEVQTITDILNALDEFDNKDEIVEAIKPILYDIETDWHTEDRYRACSMELINMIDKATDYCETMLINYNHFMGSTIFLKDMVERDIKEINNILGGKDL